VLTLITLLILSLREQSKKVSENSDPKGF